eukprot:5851251-Prymnesium_polylepis.2
MSTGVHIPLRAGSRGTAGPARSRCQRWCSWASTPAAAAPTTSRTSTDSPARRTTAASSLSSSVRRECPSTLRPAFLRRALQPFGRACACAIPQIVTSIGTPSGAAAVCGYTRARAAASRSAARPWTSNQSRAASSSSSLAGSCTR